MQTNETASQAEHFRWEIAGRPLVVKLNLDFVDRLLPEVMRGFGAMPRRGVEMGGLLLGSVDRSGERPVIVVEDYEPIPCQHSRGATYLLSEEEVVRFKETVDRWAYSEGKRTFAVGYYRSHTREGLGLGEEDLELFNRILPDPLAICLLVKPFATRVSQAGIFFRENGTVRAQSSYKEFPFRKRELGGSDEPASRPSKPESRHAAADRANASEPEAPAATPPFQSRQHQKFRSADPSMATTTATAPPSITQEELQLGLPTSKIDAKTGSKIRSGWVWIPLSFIFLLLGTVLGFQVALSLRNQLPASIRPDPYSLHMTVTPAADSLHVRWDRDASPIHSQSKGALVITDGGAQKIVALDADQLRNGSVVYRRASNDVRFRLEVYTAERVVVAETMDFRIESPAR
jgi:hypothetical protein